MSETEAGWLTAMPDELARAINRLDFARRDDAIRGWINIGADRRTRHSEAIRATRFEPLRWVRVQLILRRLIGAGETWTE